MTFVPFALLFGVASQHLGIFRAGGMAVGVTLLASALVFTVDVDRNFMDPITADAPPSNRGFYQNGNSTRARWIRVLQRVLLPRFRSFPKAKSQLFTYTLAGK